MCSMREDKATNVIADEILQCQSKKTGYFQSLPGNNVILKRN